MKFLVTQQEDSSFSFTLLDNDSHIVLSSFPFNTRDACIEAIRGLTQALPNRANFEITSENGPSFFNVISAGEIVGTSTTFLSFAEANEAADRLSTDSADEPQYSVDVQTFSASKGTTARERVLLPSLGEIDVASRYDLDYPSPKGTLGFESFNRKDKNASYFHFNDANGQALLFSRGFEGNSKREKRIRQVIAASGKNQRYEVIEEGSRFYFIIKEKNNFEIARSRSFATREEAEVQVTFVQTNCPTYALAFPEPAKRKSINQYNFEIITNFISEGFEAVKGEDKQFYFVVKNAIGNPILYSQGYGSATPRDNGIRTVIKNGVDESKYEKSEKNGDYSFILRAGNRQEVAKSPSFATVAERDIAMNWLVENMSSYAERYGVIYDTKDIITENTETFTIDMPAPVEAKTVTEPTQNLTTRQIDSYLPCDAYAGHLDSPAENFRIFQNLENTEHYFTMLSTTGKVVFRSEGYPTTAARNNGLASVKKNCLLRKRYSILEEDGKYVVLLKAGNHQEIARSCPYDTADGVYGLFPFMATGSTAALSFDDTPNASVVAEVSKAGNNMDEYLPCDAYAGHSDSPAEGIRTFSNDGMYYFSVLDKNGDVSMRSESYPTTAVRDNGVASVLKNRDNKDRYAEIEEDGVHYVILKAGNHQEIARSCPSNTKIGLLGFWPLVGLAGLGGLGFAGASAAAAIPKIKVAPSVVEVPTVVPPVVDIPTITTPSVAEMPKVAPSAYAEPEAVAIAGGLPKWLLPLLGLALLGSLLWWLMRGCKTETPIAAVETPVMVDTAKKAEVATTSSPPVAAVAGEQMDGFAPVILYFDNGEPNKNSKAVSTNQTYTQAYNKYESRKSKFSSEQDTPEAKTAMLDFFDNEVKKGHDDLTVLADNIAKQLAEGHKANITVKGFASPLAQNDYNINLTKRRISSIRNFLANHDGGKLKGMMDKISITEQANGETSAASGLNDDEKNTKLSIYDLAPSKERRVEIVDVRFVKK